MDYSIVIATRNRLPALRLSVPRMLSQSRPPLQLIVVDSSEDHPSVSKLLHEIASPFSVQLTVIQSERGASLQRNIGLNLVTTPVVFFPDDDSIFFQETAKEIMEAYERDINKKISAVCSAESTTAPNDFTAIQRAYKMTRGDKIKTHIQGLRSRIEQRLFPDPGIVLGQSFFATFTIDTIQTQNNVVPVEWMTGFRMTFRTEIIRRHQFDTHLTQYSLFEDRDASYKAWQHGAVVGARNAKIFHYRSPEKRDNGRRMGVVQLLNMAYIVSTNSPPGHPARRQLRRFGFYKAFLYLTSAKDRFGRERFQGAKAALAELPAFITVPPSEAADLYHKTMRKCLPDNP